MMLEKFDFVRLVSFLEVFGCKKNPPKIIKGGKKKKKNQTKVYVLTSEAVKKLTVKDGGNESKRRTVPKKKRVFHKDKACRGTDGLQSYISGRKHFLKVRLRRSTV